VRPGEVYKLYTSEKEESLSEYMVPEMLRYFRPGSLFKL
jgi:HrpA-like RNA helicase